MQAFLIATLTCLFVVQTVAGIKCFKCANERTVSQAHCADPFNENTASRAVLCENEMCFKRKSIGDDGTQAVTRGCMPDNGHGDRCTVNTYAGIDTEYCQCTKEGCNGATTTKITLFVTGLLVSAAALLASF